MMDQVFIQDLHIMTVIGVYDWERTKPREIVVNVTLLTDTRAAGSSDNLSDCVNYAVVEDKILKLASTSSRLTIEALAADIAQACLEEPLVKGVRVRLEKPGAVKRARSVGVEIERYVDKSKIASE